jgi:hypothetical protein
MTFPLLPGKRAQLREFARALHEERQKEYLRSQKRSGITKEVWFVQETSQGDRVLVYFEADDPVRALDTVARSEDPFDEWFREVSTNLTGIAFDHPEPWIPFQPVHWYGI